MSAYHNDLQMKDFWSTKYTMGKRQREIFQFLKSPSVAHYKIEEILANQQEELSKNMNRQLNEFMEGSL